VLIEHPLNINPRKSIICAVTNLSPEFCRKVKEARRAAKLGQTAVAAQVGCKQSALCMFENGGVTKLNDEVIDKLSKLFGVEILTLEPVDEKPTSPELAVLKPETHVPVVVPQSTKGFCPNPHCPSNHAYEVEGRIFVRPDRTMADPVGAKFCAVCGEILEKKCPNCGAPVHDGAICSHCGDPYIAV